MSPLGNEDARAQVGTKGGLSQRWRYQAGEDTCDPILDTDRDAKRSCADELDAAKLRIEEALKALPAYLHHADSYTGPWVSREAVLKIIREIL